jgi:hypothetical protein
MSFLMEIPTLAFAINHQTEYPCDGRIGYGMSKYRDRMIDGKPVGPGAQRACEGDCPCVASCKITR